MRENGRLEISRPWYEGQWKIEVSKPYIRTSTRAFSQTTSPYPSRHMSCRASQLEKMLLQNACNFWNTGKHLLNLQQNKKYFNFKVIYFALCGNLKKVTFYISSDFPYISAWLILDVRFEVFTAVRKMMLFFWVFAVLLSYNSVVTALTL
jgi:hypothetical protein